LFEVVFEDPYILIVNKPAGLQVEPDKKGHPNLFDEVFIYINSNSNIKPKQIFLAHRLDRLTSGLVMFAKKKQALLLLQEQFVSRSIVKKYFAFVEGQIIPEICYCEHYMIKDLKEFRSHVFNDNRKGSKKVSLTYKVLGFSNNLSTLDIELHTGFYHQIRAQLSHLAHPVWNDVHYGAKAQSKEVAIGLQAYAITYKHPISNEQMTVEIEKTFLF
jgi:23S rRNA pseudouridine1911/1915/1917 synthase